MIIIFNLKKILKLILCLHTIKKIKFEISSACHRWSIISLRRNSKPNMSTLDYMIFFSLSLLWCLFTTRTTSTKIQILLIIYFFLQGDSGGPLMVPLPDNRWVLAGTVSHGIKCAYPDMPGVYMRMTFYKPWIEKVTGLDLWSLLD